MSGLSSSSMTGRSWMVSRAVTSIAFLRRVQLEIVLCPLLHLLCLFGGNLARLKNEGVPVCEPFICPRANILLCLCLLLSVCCCLSAAVCMLLSVYCCLYAAAYVQPVDFGTVACGLLDFVTGSLLGLLCIGAGFGVMEVSYFAFF